jgi:hypothetical protein
MAVAPITRELWESKMGEWYVPEPNTGCWLWMKGGDGKGGYGRIPRAIPDRSAHRMAYKLLRGPIPDDMEIDHLCRVRCCVNPDHMEVVTARINTLRGMTIPAANLTKTHCPKGHPYSGDNLGDYNGARHCLACERNRKREKYKLTRGYSRGPYLERRKPSPLP